MVEWESAVARDPLNKKYSKQPTRLAFRTVPAAHSRSWNSFYRRWRTPMLPAGYLQLALFRMALAARVSGRTPLFHHSSSRGRRSGATSSLATSTRTTRRSATLCAAGQTRVCSWSTRTRAVAATWDCSRPATRCTKIPTPIATTCTHACARMALTKKGGPVPVHSGIVRRWA